MLDSKSNQTSKAFLLEANLEQSIKNLLQYKQNKILNCDFQRAMILAPSCPQSPPKTKRSLKGPIQFLSNRIHNKEAQKQYDPLTLEIFKRAQVQLATHLLETIIHTYCRKILDAPKRGPHSTTSDLQPILNPLGYLKDTHIRIAPESMPAFIKMEEAVACVHRLTHRIQTNIKQTDEHISKLVHLNLNEISTQKEFGQALSVLQQGFLELYRESTSFYPTNTVREILVAKGTRALTRKSLNRFSHQLIDFINTNLVHFDNRPVVGDFSEDSIDRNNMLHNHASMLTLSEEDQGGCVHDCYMFLRHKLLSFMALFENKMDNGTASIFRAFIENFKYTNYLSFFEELPYSTYHFTPTDFKNKQYLPMPSKRMRKFLHKKVKELLTCTLNIDVSRVGLYVPAGVYGHSSPFLLKVTPSKQFYLWCANGGRGSTGVKHSSSHMQCPSITSLSLETLFNKQEKAHMGEVVTQYGPFTSKEMVDLLIRAFFLRKLSFKPKGFNEKGEKIAKVMKARAFQSLLDSRKKVPHTTLNHLDFQWIGNCFIYNPDLLIKDRLVDHIQRLKEEGLEQKAHQAQDIFRLYHEEFMLQKQDDPFKGIPKQRKVWF